MKEIYPNNTREALEVFCLYDAQGEYFDISIPSKIIRESIVIGNEEEVQSGYYISNQCNGCKICDSVCPQKCIDVSIIPVVIHQNRCLHCGQCAKYCPMRCIKKRG